MWLTAYAKKNPALLIKNVTFTLNFRLFLGIQLELQVNISLAKLLFGSSRQADWLKKIQHAALPSQNKKVEGMQSHLWLCMG